MIKKILFISIPVIIAGLCLFFSVSAYLNYRDDFVKVPVASHQLFQRSRLEEKDLEWIDVHRTYLSEDVLCEKEDIYSLLDKPLTLEKRTPSFFVKEGKQKEFAELFNKYYGEYFELLSKEQVLKMKLFGDGEPAPGVETTFGDFVAISTREYGMIASKELHRLDTFKGHHAGGTVEERLIDISIFNA